MDKHIGARIRRLREQHGLSMRDVADVWGCTPVNVTHIELGHQTPTLEQVVALASRIGSSVDAILAGVSIATVARKSRKAG